MLGSAMLRIEKIDPFEHLEEWERIYFESARGVIFAYPKWSILSAEYNGGEPKYWMVANEKPLAYVAGSYYDSRKTLILPVFDPIFAPYSEFVILPQYRREVLENLLKNLQNGYEKMLVGPIREDSPSYSIVSKMGNAISSIKIHNIRLKGDPLEHLYRSKAYNFIKTLENMERKMDVKVEIKGFDALEEILNNSFKLSPTREFALKSVLSACRDKVKIIKVLERSKVLGYTLLVEEEDKIVVILNTVPEDKIMLGIWKYIYDTGKRDLNLEIPLPTFAFGKELGFKVINAHIYEII
ncbi:MAG: hypothetical protein ABIL19_02925 [candidate division WOR-3 bacterium]